MTMDERKKKVLQAIIQDYIFTAEPIGSRTIARKYKLGVSPATIRNEMADLEDMGYIEQPHTSAGRIPSQQGYRYYVDCLMKKHRLTKDEQGYITTGFREKVQDIGRVIQDTSRILSEMTNYTSIVMGPQFEQKTFRHVQLVPIEEGKALLVVVTESGFVQNRILDLPLDVTEQDLHQITQVLNAKLKGLNPDSIKLTLLNEIYSELSKHKRIFEAAVDLIQESFHLSQEDKVYLQGMLKMLNQPEFRDVNKVKTLLTLLEQDEVLHNMMLENAQNETGVTVKIGSENKYEGIQDCSMITATYHIDGKIVGSVGVLGPTRMEYAKVVSVVDFMTQNLSYVLQDFYKKR